VRGSAAALSPCDAPFAAAQETDKARYLAQSAGVRSVSERS
jgi:hypothetical protein